MSTRVIVNIGELITNDPTMGDGSVMGRCHDGAVALDSERVLWVGPSAQAPEADEMIDAEGAAVVPGFVDSHTHLVFAGERSDEFEARMAGERYDGGGIGRSVASTRAASTGELRRATSRRRTELLNNGVTTVEIKSGYELTTEGEVRLLDIANSFTDAIALPVGEAAARRGRHRRPRDRLQPRHVLRDEHGPRHCVGRARDGNDVRRGALGGDQGRGDRPKARRRRRRARRRARGPGGLERTARRPPRLSAGGRGGGANVVLRDRALARCG